MEILKLPDALAPVLPLEDPAIDGPAGDDPDPKTLEPPPDDTDGGRIETEVMSERL
jgi:hypothetical protein